MSDRAKELADAHWQYIESLLKAHKVLSLDIEIVGFHYRTAFIHGHGHGVEDAINEEEGI